MTTHQHVFHPATQAGFPTILALHGTGGDEHDLVPLARQIAPGAAILSPRGNVSERGAPRFFRRLAEGVFDMADLHARTAALGEWLDEMAAHYDLDRARIIALGYSNGANIAASLLLSGHHLAGGILLRAMTPFTPEKMPGLSGTNLLMLNGTHDPIIPAEDAAQLAQLFQTGGATVDFRQLPTSHGLTQEDLTLAQSWWGQNTPSIANT